MDSVRLRRNAVVIAVFALSFFANLSLSLALVLATSVDAAALTPAIAAGRNHTVALKSDGSLWAWGNNSSGQLGDGSSNASSSPRSIGSGYAAISAGGSHTLALKADGSLWAWGNNSAGQLGDGSSNAGAVPRQVAASFSAVAAGENHSLALKADGSLWTWGDNTSGQLGDGTTNSGRVPARIAEGYMAIAAGWNHSLALKADGSIWAWGNNGYLQLGDGTTNAGSVPRQIVSGFTAIAAGWAHAVALRADGSVWTWGNNSLGQLGDGSTVANYLPTRIASGFTAIAANGMQTIALKADGSLWAWGYNGSLPLADGTTNLALALRQAADSGSFSTLPRQIASGFANLAAGGYHALALKADGSVWAWGYNASGQLGDGITTGAATPRDIGFSLIAPRPSCTLAASFAAGSVVALTANCSPAAASYQWTGGGCGANSGASCSVSAAATAVYSVVGVSAAGSGNPAVTAIFRGRRSEYRISQSGSDYSVADQVSGRDGTRTVSGADHLYFADMSVNLGVQANAASTDSASVQRIEELYIAFFNRIPDADGLSYWISQYKAGSTLTQIADTFYSVATGQYAAQTGYSVSMSNSDFISRIYQNVLGRASPDSAGLNYWLASLADGSQTRGSLVNTIIGAAHSYKTDADPALRAVADLLDNKIAVAARFALTLGLSYNSEADSIAQGTAIARAVTASSTSAALALIGVSDGAAAPLPGANVQSYRLGGAGDRPTAPAIIASGAVLAPPPESAVGPFSGLWGKADEPGWGLSFIQHQASNFVLVYSYDAVGRPIWYAMPSCPLAGAACTGQLYRFGAGAPAPNWIGSASLSFDDADHGSFSFTMDGVAGSKAISKRGRAGAAGVDYSDLWGDPDEAGWGLTLSQQDASLFVLLHDHLWSGQPVWYVAPNCALLAGACGGELYQVSGGYPLTSPWYHATRVTQVGNIGFEFTDAAHATVSYSIDGVWASRRITRQQF